MFGFRKKIHRSRDNELSVDVGEVNGIRSMYLGSDTIQSSMLVKAPYDLQLAYSKGMMLFLLFAPQVKDVLVMGLGGASIPKYLYHYHPDIKIRAVELNPKVIAVARSHFFLPDNDERLQIIEGDGVEYIYENPNTTDLLMLDMFDGKGIPLDMYSHDFFDACFDCTSDDGVVAINLWGSDKNFDVYLQRIEQSFDERVLVVPTGRPGNIVVMGFKRVPSELRWDQLREKARLLDQQWQLDFMGLLERIKDHNANTNNRILME